MSSPHSPSASQEESLGRVGLIGLGNVGIIYAEHLIRASEALVVFDVDFSRLEQAVERGAQAAASSREVAAQCETKISEQTDRVNTVVTAIAPLESAWPGTISPLLLE